MKQHGSLLSDVSLLSDRASFRSSATLSVVATGSVLPSTLLMTHGSSSSSVSNDSDSLSEFCV